MTTAIVTVTFVAVHHDGGHFSKIFDEFTHCYPIGLEAFNERFKVGVAKVGGVC